MDAVDEAYAKYLSGKDVAIVGRSVTLRLADLGHVIDGHQVVVRVNNPVPYALEMIRPEMPAMDDGRFIPEEWHGDVGQRTDILFTVCGEEYTPQEDIGKWFRVLRDEGCSFLCSPYGKDGSTTHFDFLDRFDEELHSYIPFRIVGEGVREEVAKALGGSRPLAGTVAVADLLRHDIKELHLFGFTCNQLESEQFVNVRSWMGGHDGSNDISYLARLRGEDNRLVFDAKLEEIVDSL